MRHKQLLETIRGLEQNGILFEKGLTTEEFLEIEYKFSINFPYELKRFLQQVLPKSLGFVNWRDGLIFDDVANSILQRINAPLEGILYEVKRDLFWYEEWGNKPNDIELKLSVASEHLSSYPKLLPIYSHRYIPNVTCTNNLPVFSVYGSDIIYYSNNLADYFAREFKFQDLKHLEFPIEKVLFWSDMAER